MSSIFNHLKKKKREVFGRKNHQDLATDAMWGLRKRKKSKSNSAFWRESLLLKTWVMSQVVSLLWRCRTGLWNPFLLFPLLSCPVPTMIFSRGFYIYIRNKIQFLELEIFCYFFFFFLHLSIKQFYLFSLESYVAVGLIFIYLAYFFPPVVEFPHSILRMKVPNPGMNQRSEVSFLQEIPCTGNYAIRRI